MTQPPLTKGELIPNTEPTSDQRHTDYEARKTGLDATFSVYRPGDPLPSAGDFDLVAAINVFHHIPVSVRVAAMRTITGALRPGCLCVIGEYNPRSPLTQFVVNRCAFDHDAVLLAPAEVAVHHNLARRRRCPLRGLHAPCDASDDEARTPPRTDPDGSPVPRRRQTHMTTDVHRTTKARRSH